MLNYDYSILPNKTLWVTDAQWADNQEFSLDTFNENAPLVSIHDLRAVEEEEEEAAALAAAAATEEGSGKAGGAAKNGNSHSHGTGASGGGSAVSTVVSEEFLLQLDHARGHNRYGRLDHIEVLVKDDGQVQRHELSKLRS